MPGTTEGGIATRINRLTWRVPAWWVYPAGLIPLGLIVLAGLTGDLGFDPVKETEHRLGLWALKFLVAVLAITPLRRFAGINLLRYRRAIGLVAFFYAALHLLTWVVLDMGMLWGQALSDILKRPYITIGMGAFVLMVPLAITSNNRSVRKLGGAAWRRLHLLTYPAVLLGGIHYMMLVRTWETEPLLYLGGIFLFLIWRFRLSGW